MRLLRKKFDLRRTVCPKNKAFKLFKDNILASHLEDIRQRSHAPASNAAQAQHATQISRNGTT